jgi:hypothetical protein
MGSDSVNPALPYSKQGDHRGRNHKDRKTRLLKFFVADHEIPRRLIMPQGQADLIHWTETFQGEKRTCNAPVDDAGRRFFSEIYFLLLPV